VCCVCVNGFPRLSRSVDWVSFKWRICHHLCPTECDGTQSSPSKTSRSPSHIYTHTLHSSIIGSSSDPPCSPRLLLRHILSFRRRVSDSRYCSRSSRHTHRCLDFYSFIESYLYLLEFYYLLCLIHFELSGSPQREVLQFCSPSTAK